MTLVDEIKALISKTETPATPSTPTTPPAAAPATPTATTPPADPNTPPVDPKPATPPQTPENETFTRTEVEAMLKKQTEETAEAMKEIVKSFKGDGTPPIGGPAQPTDTAGDFSAWNKEIAAIDEKNKRT